MKILRTAFLVIVLLLCVTVALANRAPVTLALWPETISNFLGFGFTVTLPLFVVVGGAAALGLVLGLVWEWLRERGQRVEGAKARRELDKIRAAVQPSDTRSAPGNAARDQVLAILDTSDTTR